MFVSEMLVEPLGISNQGLARRVPHSISVTERVVTPRWLEAALSRRSGDADPAFGGGERPKDPLMRTHLAPILLECQDSLRPLSARRWHR
jgi:hypothetical protein